MNWVTCPSDSRAGAVRKGLTLIELLTVIAVISVLSALLLPALQFARESGRRTVCVNNLKQQALALRLYHSVNRSYPFGADGGWGFDWRTHLLPHLEQQNLADRVPWGEAGFWAGKDVHSENLRLLARTSLPFLRCPSHPAPRFESRSINALSGRAISSYSGNAGGDVVVDTSSDGRIDLRRGNGPLKAADMKRPGSIPVRSATLIDGLSNTILVGEVLYQVDSECGICDRFALYHPNFDNRSGNDFTEALATTRVPINSRINPDVQELAFASGHVRGCQVVFADNSVRFVAQEISPAVWQAWGSCAGRD